MSEVDAEASSNIGLFPQLERLRDGLTRKHSVLFRHIGLPYRTYMINILEPVNMFRQTAAIQQHIRLQQLPVIQVCRYLYKHGAWLIKALISFRPPCICASMNSANCRIRGIFT